MIVCHCYGITDRELLDAGRDPAGARRPESPACIAGDACGGCRPVIEELLGDRHSEASSQAATAVGTRRTDS
jgi:bacterioferritin-associated ferredoxin